MIQDALQANHLTGISLGPNCPPIHSLMFADDLIICGKAEVHEANTILQLLNHFVMIQDKHQTGVNLVFYSAKMSLCRLKKKLKEFFQLLTLMVPLSI
jgi:hypothetical protein